MKEILLARPLTRDEIYQLSDKEVCEYFGQEHFLKQLQALYPEKKINPESKEIMVVFDRAQATVFYSFIPPKPDFQFPVPCTLEQSGDLSRPQKEISPTFTIFKNTDTKYFKAPIEELKNTQEYFREKAHHLLNQKKQDL